MGGVRHALRVLLGGGEVFVTGSPLLSHQIRTIRYTLTELGSAACHGPKKELIV